MRSSRRIWVLSLAGAINFPCLAAGAPSPAQHRIVCPSEIPRQSLQIVHAPAGWTPFVPFEFRAGLPLNSAGLMWGPPSSMAISKPPIVKSLGKNKGIEKWDDLGGPAADGKWMACYYGDNGYNEAILSQRLDDNTTECSVTYSKLRHGKTIDISCKW